MKIKTYLYIIFCLLTPIPTFADSKKHQVYQGNSLNELEIWWGGDGISGNWFGWRSKLSEIGLQPFADYTFDIFGNTAGGIKRGTVYSGLLSFGIEVDLEKLVGWKGAVFLNSWKWLSGRDASEDLVGNFFTISNIAGFNTLRVFDLWLEQKLFDSIFSIKIGQFSADSEFLISDTASLFLNGTFGWPAFAYLNLPNGGQGYPMSTLGLRLQLQPVNWFSLQSALFQGNVFSQDVNRYGFRYRFNSENGATWFVESQFKWDEFPWLIKNPGGFKAGLWLQTGHNANQFSADQISTNTAIYFVFDQILFHEMSGLTQTLPSSKTTQPSISRKNVQAQTFSNQKSQNLENSQGLATFARFGVAPAQQNFTNFYFDTGFVYTGLIPYRDEDKLGIALGFTKLTSRAKSSLIDEGLSPLSNELILEATYKIQVNPWFYLQPNIQAIFNPGADSSLRDSLIVGFRGQVTF